MGLMAHNVYNTDFVATAVYGGSAEAEAGSIEESLFDEGVRMGSMGLMLHNVVGKVSALLSVVVAL